ncbi:MAG TPA: 2Fe-2S iron-sulfur cluster-binding protein, partial [Anaerolineae bacterium]
MSDQDTAVQKHHRVVFQPSGRQADVPDGTVLLDAAQAMGVEIEAICGGRQTCGKCQVVVEEGDFAKLGITSAAGHLAAPDGREDHYWAHNPRLPGRRLSCVCKIHGDLLVSVPEESQARKQVIRKAATERPIVVDPAVRLYYVEIDDASLEDPLGDWDRIAGELAARFDLKDVRLDPVLLPTLQRTIRADDRKVTVSVWQGHSAIRVVPGYSEEAYGLAVDIGTTTVALHLCDLRTGAVLATASQMNPQVPYGEDLMS